MTSRATFRIERAPRNHARLVSPTRVHDDNEGNARLQRNGINARRRTDKQPSQREFEVSLQQKGKCITTVLYEARVSLFSVSPLSLLNRKFDIKLTPSSSDDSSRHSKLQSNYNIHSIFFVAGTLNPQQ